MKLKTLSLLFLLSVSGFATASSAVATMANVLTELNHFPTAAHKVALAKIEKNGDSTANEKLLATVISGISHQASAADKAELEKILSDSSQPAAIKIVAKAVVGTMHKPQPDDLVALKTLLE